MLDLPTRHRRLVYGTLGIFLSYAVFLSFGSLEGFPDGLQVERSMPYLSDAPIIEDGYYMLTVAWNTAKGDFFTYNFGQETSGVQPLATVLYAGVAWIVQLFGGDKWSFVRGILLLGSVLHVVFAFLIGHIARSPFSEGQRRNVAFLLGWAFALLNFDLFRTFTNGLETGVYLVGLATCLLWTLSRKKISIRESIPFGLLVGIVGLIRIDFGIIFAILLVVLLIQRKISFTGALTSGIFALIVVSPWFLWVHHVTGGWLPSSGGSQSAFISASKAAPRLKAMLHGLANHAAPWVMDRFWISPSVLTAVSFGLAGPILYTLRSTDEDLPIDKDKIYIGGAWGVAIVALPLIYLFFFFSFWFYARYTAPVTILLLPGLAIATTFIVKREYHTRLLYSVSPLLILCFFFWAGRGLHFSYQGGKHADTAGFIENYIPENYKVGSFQSGVVGFFNPNALNLDGKINHNALKYKKEGEMKEYIEKEEVDVVVVGRGEFESIGRNYFNEGWRSCQVGAPRNRVCRIRTSHPPLTSDSTQTSN